VAECEKLRVERDKLRVEYEKLRERDKKWDKEYNRLRLEFQKVKSVLNKGRAYNMQMPNPRHSTVESNRSPTLSGDVKEEEEYVMIPSGHGDVRYSRKEQHNTYTGSNHTDTTRKVSQKEAWDIIQAEPFIKTGKGNIDDVRARLTPYKEEQGTVYSLSEIHGIIEELKIEYLSKLDYSNGPAHSALYS
jgi:hypothetical protein